MKTTSDRSWAISREQSWERKKEKKRKEIWVFERELDYYTIQYEFVGLWECLRARAKREKKRKRETRAIICIINVLSSSFERYCMEKRVVLEIIFVLGRDRRLYCKRRRNEILLEQHVIFSKDELVKRIKANCFYWVVYDIVSLLVDSKLIKQSSSLDFLTWVSLDERSILYIEYIWDGFLNCLKRLMRVNIDISVKYISATSTPLV